MGVGALLDLHRRRAALARFIRPLADVLGWPATQIGGAAGALARDNARRNPQRTASTASALMIGLALVTLVAVLAAGIIIDLPRRGQRHLHERLRDHRTEQLLADPDPAGEAAAEAPGVTAIGTVRTGETQVFGSDRLHDGGQPGTEEVITLDWDEGSQRVLATARRDGAFVDNDFAEDHDLQLGSAVAVTFVDRRDGDVPP